ncbi:hypothetical protein [Kitasatospora sp. NPDC094011]
MEALDFGTEPVEVGEARDGVGGGGLGTATANCASGRICNTWVSIGPILP